jgi:hypothetical protein
MTVDFPERRLSYAIYECKDADLARCVLEVNKAVNSHLQGMERNRLEIRFIDSN